MYVAAEDTAGTLQPVLDRRHKLRPEALLFRRRVVAGLTAGAAE